MLGMLFPFPLRLHGLAAWRTGGWLSPEPFQLLGLKIGELPLGFLTADAPLLHQPLSPPGWACSARSIAIDSPSAFASAMSAAMFFIGALFIWPSVSDRRLLLVLPPWLTAV